MADQSSHTGRRDQVMFCHDMDGGSWKTATSLRPTSQCQTSWPATILDWDVQASLAWHDSWRRTTRISPGSAHTARWRTWQCRTCHHHSESTWCSHYQSDYSVQAWTWVARSCTASCRHYTWASESRAHHWWHWPHRAMLQCRCDLPMWGLVCRTSTSTWHYLAGSQRYKHRGASVTCSTNRASPPSTISMHTETWSWAPNTWAGGSHPWATTHVGHDTGHDTVLPFTGRTICHGNHQQRSHTAASAVYRAGNHAVRRCGQGRTPSLGSWPFGMGLPPTQQIFCMHKRDRGTIATSTSSLLSHWCTWWRWMLCSQWPSTTIRRTIDGSTLQFGLC